MICVCLRHSLASFTYSFPSSCLVKCVVAPVELPSKLEAEMLQPSVSYLSIYPPCNNRNRLLSRLHFLFRTLAVIYLGDFVSCLWFTTKP